MKKSITLLFLLTLSLTSFSAFSAVKIVECEDEEGNRSFQKACPPGFTVVGEKKIATGSSSNKETQTSNIQAIVYLVPDCDACDEVKEFLSGRKVSITEKNVKDDLELQNELNELAGALKVPTTIIGDKVLSGYSRKDFMSALEASGYKEEGS